MKKFLSWKLITIFLSAIFLSFYALPSSTQQTLLPFLPENFSSSKVHLGLDLQGGSQLDYKIDLRKVPENDRESIVDGVKEVIEKRVNGLGVAEPNIYIADVADEKHIVVELAETASLTQQDVDQHLGKVKNLADLTDDEKKLVSLEKAKATVGKTILLEFKEPKDALDPDEENKIRQSAANALERIKSGSSFDVVGQEEMQAYPGQVSYETSEFTFESELDPSMASAIKSLAVGAFHPSLLETGGSFTVNAEGQVVENKSLSIVKLESLAEEIINEKEVDASQILISFKDAENASEEITRTKEEAKQLAESIKKEAAAGKDFAVLAQENSDDAATKEQGGRLNEAITGDGTYLFDLEEAGLEMTEAGQLSEVIETANGYIVLKANAVRTDVKETQYKFKTISFSLVPDPWQETPLTGQHFVHADMQLDQFFQPYVSIQFDDEGAKLFEEMTERNINRQIAIFVGGELISAPRVNEKIAGGQAQINGQFTVDEAKELARDLNTGAIPAPIVLTGEYTIGASLGQAALSQSIQAGLIGMAAVALFMGIFYRISGIMAIIALAMYALILLFLIKSELNIGLAIIAALSIFGYLVNGIINSKDSGWEKFLSFLLSFVGFFFLMHLLQTGIVMTLAGIAGIILSIGMAVDANILIFERFKEEIREGKNYKAAIETGFEKAWSAIRDSNFSTLITCAILFYFGSSIIKGFAFNLAAGILVSMFTAIVITRSLLGSFIGAKIANNLQAFGVNPTSKISNFDFVGRTKVWLSASACMILISLVAIFGIGLKLGIDFQGGTLMEFKFSEKVEKNQLTEVLSSIEDELNATGLPQAEDAAIVEESQMNEDTISAPEDLKLDLKTAQVLASDENSFIVKSKYIDSATHDSLINKMQEQLPEFQELRFTTIGPVIGETLLQRALIAVVIALIVIIIYVALAFRKMPKEVSSWKFGATAIAALAHDMIIVTGIFALLGLFLGVEIDALFITAMLTVLGYSVNDTIIIFDRIRENLINNKHNISVDKVTNDSLNQTLTRSINTSLSTLLTLIAVLAFGSQSIFFFILALTLGIVVGTYSSIFVAAPLMVLWNKQAKK